MNDSKAPWYERLEAWSKSDPKPTRPRTPGSKPWYDKVAEWADRQPVIYGGIMMKAGKLSYRGEYQPVAGVRVRVESAGELQRRSTLTRTAAGGLLFGPAGAIVGALFKKTVDKRELYLLVDGPVFAWAVEVRASDGPAARSFAAKVNTASHR